MLAYNGRLEGFGGASGSFEIFVIVFLFFPGEVVLGIYSGLTFYLMDGSCMLERWDI